MGTLQAETRKGEFKFKMFIQDEVTLNGRMVVLCIQNSPYLVYYAVPLGGIDPLNLVSIFTTQSL